MPKPKTTKKLIISQDEKRSRKKAVHMYAEKWVSLQDKPSTERMGEVKKIIEEAKLILPWITRDMIVSRGIRMMKRKITLSQAAAVSKSAAPRGRPKGSTKLAKIELENKEQVAKIEMTKRLRQARKECQASRLPNGHFQHIHDTVLEELELADTGFKISRHTIHNRAKKPHDRVHFGPEPPAANIEPVVVEFVKQRQQAGQPLTSSETIDFANSLIKQNRVKVRKAVKKFHESHKNNPDQLLGKGWLKGFHKRYAHILSPAKGRNNSNSSLMRVVITGGGGFLGQALAKEILEQGTLRCENKKDVAVSEIIIGDILDVETWLFESLSSSEKVKVSVGDICNEAYCESLLGEKAQGLCIFHLGAVMSGAGEADFDLAMNVNLRGTTNMLESARKWHSSTGVKPTFIFVSSLATVGSGLDTDWVTSTDIISDQTRAAPHTTYGMTKACGELLLSDFHRRGFVDGRGVRLPTVIVRAGSPNAATTSCFSSVIREPLNGTDVVLPIAPDLNHAVTSYKAVVQGILAIQAATPELADRVLGPYDRTAFLPSQTVSLQSLYSALLNVVDADSLSSLGSISYQQDEFLTNVLSSFPTKIDSSRALSLGAPPAPDLYTMILEYCHDFPNAVHPDLKLLPPPS